MEEGLHSGYAGASPSCEQLAAQDSLAGIRLRQAITVIGGEDAVTAMQPSLAARRPRCPGGSVPGDPRRLLRVVFYGENGINRDRGGGGGGGPWMSRGAVSLKSRLARARSSGLPEADETRGCRLGSAVAREPV